MRRPFALLIIACLVLAGPANAGISVRPVVWILAIDDSASVPDNEFRMYPQMLRRAALEQTRPNDTVIFMRLDTLAVDSVVLDGRYSRQRQQLEDLYRTILATPKRKRGGFTDFRRVLEYARERMQIERQAGKPDSRYVLVFATDGKPDPDAQRKPSSPANASYVADWRMLHIGLHPENEAALRVACRDAGFVDESRILLVSIGQWGSVDSMIARFIERQPDTTLQRVLAKVAPATPAGPR